MMWNILHCRSLWIEETEAKKTAEEFGIPLREIMIDQYQVNNNEVQETLLRSISEGAWGK